MHLTHAVSVPNIVHLTFRTGTGALSANAIAFLRSGVMTYLSNPTPVIFVDPSKTTGATPDDVTQCLFYFATVASNEAPTTASFTLFTLCPGAIK